MGSFGLEILAILHGKQSPSHALRNPTERPRRKTVSIDTQIGTRTHTNDVDLYRGRARPYR